MKPHNPAPRKGPEKILQERGERWFRAKGWYVMRTHGNMYQSGFPDNSIFAIGQDLGTEKEIVRKLTLGEVNDKTN